MLHYFLLSALSVVLFLHGFFPITNNNKEYNNNPPISIENFTLNVDEVYKSEFNNAIIVIIDALRLDFVEPHYMPLLTSIARKNGCYNKITVESPTVTLPRIKAITTGSVPQFIDIVTNLASAQILEDSLIHSARKSNNKVVFYGDDIWLKLFPKEFLRAEGTTSFFVKDFTEVDDNVTRNVELELKRNDWDNMVLHYLGLDHIGHVLGPFSPLISAKLTEMDKIIYKMHQTMAKRSEATLLIITGDHGMRDSGGHGGSTFSEKNVPLIVVGTKCRNNSFAQTDIPANLAVLLGLRIPSTSIGQLHASLLNNFSLTKYLYALRYNTLLLNEKKGGLCGDNVTLATQLHLRYLSQDNDVEIGKKAVELYESCSAEISKVLFNTSVKQNVFSLVISIISMGNLLIILTWKLFVTKKIYLETCQFFFLFALVSLQLFCYNDAFSFILTLLSLVLMAKNAIGLRKINLKNTSTVSFVLTVLTIVHPLTFTSSSFEEEEHQFWYFCLNFFILVNIVANAKSCQLQGHLPSLLALTIGLRFLRSLNQTGDKWARWPDLSDWLLQKDNQLYFQLFFILGLISVFACIRFLSTNRSFSSTFLSLSVLVCIYLFKNFDYKNVLMGRFIWFLILFYIAVFSRNNLVIGWIFVASLLLKPHNLLLIGYCVYASHVFHQLFSEELVLTLVHLFLGNAMYFAQGHSNSLASVDISVGYIGLDSYEPILVVAQVLCHTYALPVLCNALLLRNRQINGVKVWTVLFMDRVLVIMVTCIVTLIHRHHLFIWSVFAPKLFIEANHSGFLLVQVLFYYLKMCLPRIVYRKVL